MDFSIVTTQSALYPRVMLSDKQWKPEAVLMMASAVMFCLMAVMCAGLAIQFLLPKLPETDKKFLLFVSTSVGFHGMILLLTHTFLRSHEVSWIEFLGLDRPALLGKLMLAVTVTLVLTPLAIGLNELSYYVLSRLQTQPPELQSPVVVLQSCQAPWQRVLFTVSAVGLIPAAEETLFRGVLYTAVKQQGYPRLAFYGTSILFGAIHLSLMAFIPLTLFAMVMIFLYERTRSLLAPIVAHALFNAANLGFFFLLPPPPA